jgi:hypothetical protein
MKTALLFRLGGLGDIIILGIVAKELKKRGYVVDACFGSPTVDPEELFKGTGIFRKIIKYTRSFNGVDCYETPDGDLASIELLKEHYDLPVDYKYAVELNGFHKELSGKPGLEWMVSQNSNYVNWMDIMLSWAGIDPESVHMADKRPEYIVADEELKWAKGVFGECDVAITIQTNASSLVRTWYHPSRLPEAILDEYNDKNIAIAVFDGTGWHLIKGKTSLPILVPSQFNPIRASAALVGASTVFIGADSGFSHIAEALSKPSITIYTTVPAWTRQKYYKYARAVEPVGDTFNGIKCRPCFVLDRYCPRVREAALSQLTEREVKIKKAAESGADPSQIALELETTQQGLMMEWEMIQKRIMALFEGQAPCSKTITTERIMEQLREVLGESSS